MFRTRQMSPATPWRTGGKPPQRPPLRSDPYPPGPRLRARRDGRLSRSGRLSAPFRRRRGEPRSADAERLVEGPRHRDPRRARHPDRRDADRPGTRPGRPPGAAAPPPAPRRGDPGPQAFVNAVLALLLGSGAAITMLQLDDADRRDRAGQRAGHLGGAAELAAEIPCPSGRAADPRTAVAGRSRIRTEPADAGREAQRVTIRRPSVRRRGGQGALPSASKLFR